VTLTVEQLIKELQRAVIMDELDEDSEVLNGDLHPADLYVSRSGRHAVVE
jgi:hypothetical protein